MKIYDKFNFWTAVVFAITAPIVWWLTDWFSWTALVFCGAIVLRGLYQSLSKEAYEKAQRTRKRGIQFRRRIFGPLAPIAPLVPLILVLAAGGVTEISWLPFAWMRGIIIALLGLAVCYVIVYKWLIDKYRDADADAS